MRIGSIVYTTQQIDDGGAFLTAANMCQVVAQDGNGLKVAPLGSPAMSITLQPGQFHRLHDKQLETLLQGIYKIEKGEHLSNPNKPVYHNDEEDTENDEEIDDVIETEDNSDEKDAVAEVIEECKATGFHGTKTKLGICEYCGGAVTE